MKRLNMLAVVGFTWAITAMALNAQTGGGDGQNLIPEPGTLTLAALGGGCLLLRWRWKHRRNGNR